MRKRITSALLTLVMLLSLVPAMGTTAAAAEDTRSAPDRVQSYIAASGFTATALNPNQAKFTYVEITSNSNSDTDSGRSMQATVKCVTVTNTIAQKIGYNGGNATVSSEDLLNQLKTKLKASKDYYKPSEKTLFFGPGSNAVRHQDIGKGTCRYLLSVEAYFNGTYYFDGAGINFETDYQGNGRYTVYVQVCGMTIYPDTASGEGDPQTKLKLVIDNQIGREFTNTNAAPNGYYGLENYPGTYVANFRWICMPNTDLEIELRNNTVLHVGKYFRSSSSDVERKTNIDVDNLTISGNGVLLASNFNNLPSGAKGTAGSVINTKSLTVDSSNVVLDLTRDGSYNCIEVPTPGAFKPINAKSIKLTAETGHWISGLSNNDESLKNAYSAYWNSFPIEADSGLRRVTFGRTAELSNLKLNVGGNSYAKDAVIPDHVVSSDASKKLSVSFDAGPQWFTTYYLKNKINLNARVYIWKDGEFQSNFSIAQMTGGRTDGTLGFTLDVRNLALEADHTYRVYVSVSPTMNGEYPAEPLTAQWTFKTVSAPVEKPITAVGLMQNFYLYPTGDSSNNEPNITISGNSQPYTITNEGNWAQSTTESEVYTRTVTLKANDGYKFTDSTKVTAVNADGAKPVDGVSKELQTDGTLKVTITTYKRYTVDFLKPDGTGGMATQYVIKNGKAVAPENRYAVPDGKIFAGWKKNLSDSAEEAILPGEETEAITANTKYYTYTETVIKPEYSIEVEKTYVPAQTSFDSLTFELTIRNTGTAATGNLSVTFRSNSGNYSMYYNTYDEEETATKHEPDATGVLTIPSIPVGDSVVVCLELPEVTGACVSSCAVQVQNTENGIDRSVIVKTMRAAFNTVEVENGTADSTSEGEGAYYEGYVVTIRARAAGDHEKFVGWTVDADSPVQVVFSDPTAPVTQFVMPGNTPQITANFVTATVNGIAITKMPTKTAYEAGESFDPAGIDVKLTYTDGTMEALPAGATLAFDPGTSTALTTSNDSVKVSYTHNGTELVTYLTITVKKPDAKKYTVTYDPGEGSGTMLSETATEGEKFPLPTICTFTPPTGKVFDQWQFGDDTSTYYQPGQSVDITADTTVKAIWKELPAGAVKVDPPTAAGPFTYDGSEKTGVATGSGYGLTDTDKAINAGTYTVIATLTASDSYWTDGTQQPKLIEWTINPANRDGKPDAPEMASRTTDSITLKAITAPTGETVEYSMDGSYWQSSTTFTGLSSGTGYTFYARYAAKTNYNPSAASEGATFFTLSGGSSSGSTAYTVTVLGSKNGAVTADRKTASAGSTVTLTVTPDKGYTLETLTVLDKSGKEIKLTEKNGKYTFAMPASNVEVKATFMDDNTMLNFFVDVKPGDYFYDAVLWAAEKGITGGTDATHFSPNGICTRAQAVTFLWRAAGSPAPKSTAMPFTDVPAGSYYEQAVLWAVENGITKGTGDTTFSPNATCSRAQIVTFLWRSQKSPAAGSVNPFTDVKSDAYYADAVLWAVKESVTSGTTATTFSPNADCTRAQIVTFIYRALAE